MINSISFRNHMTPPQGIKFKAAPKYNLSFGKNSYTNLGKDTVSFSGHKLIEKDDRTKTLNKDLMNAFDNRDVCFEVYEEARTATRYLEDILTNRYSNMLIRNNPKGTIVSLDIRVKSPDSIREKIASQLGAAITSPKPFAFNPNKKEEIKTHCTDLIGARVIMANASQKNTKKLLDGLIEDIKSGKLKITDIEHYVYADDPSLNYFNSKDLKRLEDAVNEQRASKGYDPIHVKEKVKTSGYTALHLDVDLSSSDFKVRESGYKGEIQFVGYDVCQFKELEDLCYKIRSNKDIKSGNYAYAPFAKYFLEQMANKNYPNLKEDFIEYTRRTYAIQRRKASKPEQFANRKRPRPIFPSIQECGMEGKIPESLDFNLLNKIKASCDNIYRNTNSFANSRVA